MDPSEWRKISAHSTSHWIKGQYPRHKAVIELKTSSDPIHKWDRERNSPPLEDIRIDWPIGILKKFSSLMSRGVQIKTTLIYCTSESVTYEKVWNSQCWQECGEKKA